MMSAKQVSTAKFLPDVLEGFETTAKVPDMTFNKMSSNSQLVGQDDVFLALKGVNRHGIDFCLNVNKCEAAFVLYDSDDDYVQQRLPLLGKQLSVPLLGVKGLNQCYGEILSRFYGEPSKKMMMVGVTGTDGKTSVTHLLAQALTRLGQKVGTIGTLGVGVDNQLSKHAHTTPDADSVQSYLADFLQQGCETVVMEVSSHALHQYRVAGCEFDLALLTNLGSDHLDYHHDVAHYAEAKERLFHWESLNTRVVNGDDIFGQALALKFKHSHVLSYSAKNCEKSDVVLKKVVQNEASKDLYITTSLGCFVLKSRLIGNFNIENILALVSVLVGLGFELAAIQKACNDLQGIPGRMQQIETSSTKQVIVDFAHTEQALVASLKAARLQTKGQLICVFGCGGNRDKSKRSAMGKAAEQHADCLIITDDNPRFEEPSMITDAILSGCQHADKHQVIHDRKQAIEYAIELADEHDTVLIAGKGHEDFQVVRDQHIPFSDQYVASQFFKVKA